MLPDVRSWPARMGVRPGGNIMLMADLTRVAWAHRKAGQRFSAEVFLDAFLEQLGPDGTLVIPTFNYDLKAGEAFDVRRTPTISGALGQAALAHPAFQRTAQPLHSFAVASKLQRSFVRIDDPSSFGQRSAFALLHGHNFRLLAIDMPLEPAFTYVHFVEESMSVGYRRWKQIPIQYTDLQGGKSKKVFTLYAKRPGYVNDFKALEPVLTSANVLVAGEVDGSSFLSLELTTAHAVIEEDILNNKGRSIVRFSLKWWLRDHLKPLLRGGRSSRSALSIK